MFIHPSLDECSNIFSYEPDTGIIRFKVKRPGYSIGDIAGHNMFGYTAVTINGKNLMCHRLAWALYYGEWPSNFIDHINRDRKDNRIENLRKATHSQNSANRNNFKNNTSGIKNIYWDKKTNKWNVRVKHNKKNYWVGSFNDINEANIARIDFCRKLFGEYYAE